MIDYVFGLVKEVGGEGVAADTAILRQRTVYDEIA